MSTGPPSPLVRRLSKALAADARAEVELAVRVGVLAALHYSRAEIAESLGIGPAEVKAAFDRLRRVGNQLGDDGLKF